MKKQWKWIAMLVGAGVLAGCAGGQDVHYYTLSPTVTVQQSVASSDAWTKPYRVTVAGLSGQMNETTIVVRQSDNRLMVLTYDRWGSPLQEQVQQSLTQALTNELGVPPIQGMPGDNAADVVKVNVQIQGFELEPAKQAVLETVWQVTSVKPAKQLICHSVSRQASEPGVAPLVQAQQLNVQDLAKQIAQTLRTNKAPTGVQCTTR